MISGSGGGEEGECDGDVGHDGAQGVVFLQAHGRDPHCVLELRRRRPLHGHHQAGVHQLLKPAGVGEHGDRPSHEALLAVRAGGIDGPAAGDELEQQHPEAVDIGLGGGVHHGGGAADDPGREAAAAPVPPGGGGGGPPPAASGVLLPVDHVVGEATKPAQHYIIL